MNGYNITGSFPCVSVNFLGSTIKQFKYRHQAELWMETMRFPTFRAAARGWVYSDRDCWFVALSAAFIITLAFTVGMLWLA